MLEGEADLPARIVLTYHLSFIKQVYLVHANACIFFLKASVSSVLSVTMRAVCAAPAVRAPPSPAVPVFIFDPAFRYAVILLPLDEKNLLIAQSPLLTVQG
jgi:hypothetical protein